MFSRTRQKCARFNDRPHDDDAKRGEDSMGGLHRIDPGIPNYRWQFRSRIQLQTAWRLDSSATQS